MANWTFASKTLALPSIRTGLLTSLLGAGWLAVILGAAPGGSGRVVEKDVGRGLGGSGVLPEAGVEGSGRGVAGTSEVPLRRSPRTHPDNRSARAMFAARR